MNSFQLMLLGKAKDEQEAAEIIELEREAGKPSDRKDAKTGVA
jgi:hypothetical protein